MSEEEKQQAAENACTEQEENACTEQEENTAPEAEKTAPEGSFQ